MREITPFHVDSPSTEGASLNGAVQLQHRGEDKWSVLIDTGEKTFTKMGTWTEPIARAVFVHACKYQLRAAHAVRKLHEEADDMPIEAFVEQAMANKERPHRRVKAIVELHLEMRGSDEEILQYIQSKTFFMIRVKSHSVISMEDE